MTAPTTKTWRCKLQRRTEDAYMLMGLFVSVDDRYVFGFDVDGRHGTKGRAFTNSLQERIENGEAPATLSFDRPNVIRHIARFDTIDRIDVFTDYLWMQVVYQSPADGRFQCIEFFQQDIEARKAIGIEIADTLNPDEQSFLWEPGPKASQPQPQPSVAEIAEPKSFFAKILGGGDNRRMTVVEPPSPSTSLFFK